VIAEVMTSWFGLTLAAVLGASVGSFLNVVVYRVPRDLSIIRPGSACPRCERPIRAWENVPVLSWIFLRGRCAGCKERISVRYPIVEAITSALFVVILWHFGFGIFLPFLFFFAAALVAVAWIDLDFRIIPDEISLGGLAIGLLGSFFLPVTLPQALLGAAIGGGVLWGLGWAYEKSTGVEGMGGGDVKLAAMIGAFLGPGGVVFTLFLASLMGTIVGGGMMALSGAGRKTALPFGTFLAPAALVALFAAPLFFAWYGGLLAAR